MSFTLNALVFSASQKKSPALHGPLLLCVNLHYLELPLSHIDFSHLGFFIFNFFWLVLVHYYYI